MPNNRRPILGLLNYSYLAAKSGLTLIFGTAALLGVIFVLAIWQNWRGELALFFPLIQLLLAAGPIFSVMSNSDRASGWSRYQAAMPISRQQLVAAKFLPALLVTAAGTILTLLIFGATRLVNAQRYAALVESGHWVTGGTMVVVAPLLATAIYIPVAALRRNRGGDMPLLVVCLIGAFAASQYLFAFTSRFVIPNMTPNIVLLATIGFAAIALLISYLATRLIYTRISI